MIRNAIARYAYWDCFRKELRKLVYPKKGAARVESVSGTIIYIYAYPQREFRKQSPYGTNYFYLYHHPKGTSNAYPQAVQLFLYIMIFIVCI